MLKPWPIIGHKKITKSLRRSIEENKIAHAYLFSGVSELGKKTLALHFLKTCLCQAQDRPCNICQSCKLFDAGSHPDVYILENRQTIKIFQTRELKRKVSLRPLVSPYKACLIDDAACLTHEAANSLLKIVEEPQGQTIIVFITSNIKTVLPTIVSRCLVYNFRPENLNDFSKELTLHLSQEDKGSILKLKKIFGHDAFEILVKLSSGRCGLFFEMIRHPHMLQERQEKIKKLKEILKKKYDLPFLFQYAERLSKDKDYLKKTFDVWEEALREILLNKTKGEKSFQEYDFGFILTFLKRVIQAKVLIQENINPRLICENLFLQA